MNAVRPWPAVHDLVTVDDEQPERRKSVGSDQLRLRQRAVDCRAVVQVALNKGRARIDRRAMSLNQAVEHRDAMPRVQGLLDKRGPDVTRPARDE